MMRKVGIILVMLAAMVSTALAQTGKIAGQITDEETGQPLPGVNVLIEGTNSGAATDENGHYYIVNVDPGRYSVTAQMIGYTKVTKTGVLVSTNHTTPLDFSLTTEAIAGQAVTVEAKREVVEMDKSASEITATAQEVQDVPMVSDLSQYVGAQAGVEGLSIRGGRVDETKFMVDGLTVVDNRTNQPMMMVNLSAVKEVNLVKGGFNAEYGNVRSGLINVVTKEGARTQYNGSINFRYTPPHLKHRGNSLLGPNNYYTRPYLDPQVAWDGTDNWDPETRERYPSFKGWNKVSEELMADDDPHNNMTPKQAQERFIWLHALKGADSLGQSPRDYGNKPDWQVDASFGGPVPGISDHLGNLRFFISHRSNWELFGLPTSRDYFKEKNTQLKLTTDITQNIKMTIEGLYGELNSVASSTGWGAPLQSGDGIFYSSLTNVASSPYSFWSGGNLYWPLSLNPYDVYRSMGGISWKHILSANTFYDIRISGIHTQYLAKTPALRDTSTVRYFGSAPVNKSPYGYWYAGEMRLMQDGMLYSGTGAETRDWSRTNTINAKFDLTSQVNRYHQLKVGFTYTYDDIHNDEARSRPATPEVSWFRNWRAYPYRGGAYAQDKIEFEGMIANLGVRVDYNNPNTDWYTVNKWSKYLKNEYLDVFQEKAPKERAHGHVRVSPRLGISHPITEFAKLFFNYGHFYSMPQSENMFEIRYHNALAGRGIEFLGNPSAQLPKTIAYELGAEFDVANLFMLRVSGFYKDVTDQESPISYTNYRGTIDYTTILNNNYEDIRGFELMLERRFGRWISGWANYTYQVTTSGFVGRRHYYEDPREQRRFGRMNPYQERPLVRPFARANIMFHSPNKWGPRIAGTRPLGNAQVIWRVNWRAGSYFTWDPLQTNKLDRNLQWKSLPQIDLSLRKLFQIGRSNFTVFADIQNVFDFKYFSDRGFSTDTDRKKYLESLHLPMYKGKEYQDRGYTPGNDKPGDIKSKDKPYIDMPDREFLTYFNPRTVVFGFRVNF